MARNNKTTKLYGATEMDSTDNFILPDWMDRFNTSTAKSIEEWTDSVTQHSLLNVAFGEGEDVENFELDDETKMVVTMDDHEPIATVSNRFNLVDNQRVISFLVEVLDNLNLNDVVFGEGNAYNNMFVVDLFFDDDGLVSTLPNGDHLATGISLMAANDKSSSIKACPTIWDGNSQTMIRGVGDGWDRVKHVKPEGVSSEEVDMYDRLSYMITETILELEDVGTEWKESVQQAMDLEVNFQFEDFTPEQFYKVWLGENVPQKIVDDAVKAGQVRDGIISDTGTPVDDPTQSFWSLVMGFTHGYTHASNMSDGQRKKQFHDTARDAIMNPESTLNSVRRDFVVSQEENGTDDTEDTDTDADEQEEFVQKATETSESIRQTQLAHVAQED